MTDYRDSFFAKLEAAGNASRAQEMAAYYVRLYIVVFQPQTIEQVQTYCRLMRIQMSTQAITRFLEE